MGQVPWHPGMRAHRSWLARIDDALPLSLERLIARAAGRVEAALDRPVGISCEQAAGVLELGVARAEPEGKPGRQRARLALAENPAEHAPAWAAHDQAIELDPERPVGDVLIEPARAAGDRLARPVLGG